MRYNRIRYKWLLALLLLVGSSAMALAQDDYNPDNPSDPGQADQLCSYKVTVASGNEEAGTVSGGGKYTYGTSVTISASANEGYRFVQWTKYGQDGTYSTSSSFTYTVPAGNTSFTAEFAHRYKVTLARNLTAGGTVSGGGYDDQFADGKTTISTTLNANYAFLYWLKNDETEPYTTAQSFEYTFGTEDVMFTAVYEYVEPVYDPDSPSDPGSASTMLSYNVRLNTDDAAAGTLTGAGRYKYGTNVSISASTNTGYEFQHWKKGDDVYSQAASFTYKVVAEDVDFTAVYKYVGIPVYYKLTFEASPSGSCTFSQTSGKQYEEGDAISVTATPSAEHTFLGWYIDGEKVSEALTYSSTMPAADLHLVAMLEYSPDDPADPKQFILMHANAQPAAYGSVSPSSAYVELGSTVGLVATPNEGYTFSGWYRGTTLLSTSASYNHTLAKNDTLFTAYFKPANPKSGDVNADDKVTIVDEAMLVSVLGGAPDYYGLSDIDGNGAVELADASIEEELILGKEVLPTAITLDKTETTLNVDATLQLSASFLPVFATDKTITWTSSDEAVATVSADGVVTGVGDGTAIITATTVNGLTASCNISVVSEVNYEDWTSTNAGQSSSSSSHTYTIEYREGQTLSFDWSVSSESGWDWLTITLDGSQIVRSSGVNSGTYTNTFTTSGTATLVATYSKDGSVNNNSDQGKLTNVKLK